MPLKSFLSAAALSVGLLVPGVVLADTWTVDPAKSQLAFEVVQAGSSLKGVFETWTAEIEFDPDTPETAEISAEITTLSAATGNQQFDGTLPGRGWFNVNEFPVATFTTTDVSPAGDGAYVANGTLTIRDISLPIAVAFTLDIEGDTATAKGEAKVNRADYKLGAEVSGDTVGEVVTVTLDLTATR
ncbi:YceI family protein [Labrenzia sp. CE80]|uniref:YceI family protein n=1 Tax=Labrenzia sp. CE80 TaxID=1788986 RepID=UPI00129AA8A7|nr:YceI family protein [Labrenzia sp. CE80]